MTEQERKALDECYALDERIASGEIPFWDAIELLVERGVPRSLAGRRVGLLTGRLRDDTMPDPKTAPNGLYL